MRILILEKMHELDPGADPVEIKELGIRLKHHVATDDEFPRGSYLKIEKIDEK